MAEVPDPSTAQTNAVPDPPGQKPRTPRYPTEGPLQDRTSENDKSALKLVRKAFVALTVRREEAKKARDAKKNDGEEDDVRNNYVEEDHIPPINKALQDDASVDPYSLQMPAHIASRIPETHLQPMNQGNDGEEDTSSSGKTIYGSYPEIMLPLKSMYDGTGEWPKRKGHGLPKGAKFPSWANTGFPKDPILVVNEFEDATYIEKDADRIVRLAQDIVNIKTRPVDEMADNKMVSRQQENHRTIESFTLDGQCVNKIKFDDCDKDFGGYGSCKTSKEFEKQINKVMRPPSLEMEQWVATQLLLAHGGQIGGRTQDYWRKARDLAQQQLHINPNLEGKVREGIARGHTNDPAFTEMLGMVKQSLKQKFVNPYHQSMGDEYAVANGLFHHMKDTDITIVLDKNDKVIAFFCSDAFRKLLT